MNRQATHRALLALFLLLTPLLYAQQSTKDSAAAVPVVQDPLVRILLDKGVITTDEARFIGAGANQREKLLYLLKEKGVLSNADLDQLALSPTSTGTQPAATYQPAVLTRSSADDSKLPTAKPPAAEIKPPVPAFIAAVAPIRVLQVDPSKKDGLLPDIKLGSGARLKLYGFLKASAVHDTSSPYGNDFPLPGFIGSVDTGPNRGSEFHVKARASRIGAQFDWPDISPKLSITGKIELDFEGNFSRTNNRNISTIRSSMPSIRLAFGRLDYKMSDKTTLTGEFGQDWTPFASSTLPNLLETTGLGIGFGVLWERSPQMRFGLVHNFGGGRNFTINPEFAIVMPTAGIPPATVNSASTFGAAFVGSDNQLGYGERQGADSGRPQFQGRVAFQWQLDKAKGVAPAQLVFSAMDGERSMLVPFTQYGSAANYPTSWSTATQAQIDTLARVKAAFPHGASMSSSQKGATVELQLPTRFVTVLAKYYAGEDLRYYFAGGLYSTFNDTTGLTGTIAVAGVDGNTIIFGTNSSGAATIAPQRPVRTEGGLINLGFPIGRLINADPASRAAGWQFYLHYSVDDPYSRDVRRTGAISATSAGLRDRSDLSAATLYWKINSLVTFGWEESYYRTRLSNGSTENFTTPTWDGGPARSWHDFRSEFSTIFSF
ncbi:MAG: hypothetical protein ACM3JB_09415 [Acidobacteriaceae bacterium]